MTAWLVRLAARRWPVELRDELREEWLAELHALRAEPHGDWLALRFGVSLAVRRPAASLVPAIPTLREHRTLYVMLTPLLLIVLGQAAVGIAMLVLVLALRGLGSDSESATSAALIAFPVVAGALSAVVGLRLGRANGWHSSSRLVAMVSLAMMAGILGSRAFLAFGEGLEPSLASGLWIACFAAVALLVVRTRSWLLAVIGVLVVTDVAVTTSLALRFSDAQLPREAIGMWFMAAFGDDVIELIGLRTYLSADATSEANDFLELFPSAVLVVTAFGFGYVVAAARRLYAVSESFVAKQGQNVA